jgi:uncharacterized alkaline shock family protein YloU
VPERPAPGRAVVTRRAVTDIIRTAVLGCYGVAGFATPDPWGYVVRWMGLGEPGIRIDLDDLRVELRIRVAYGLPIAEVARQVESAVRYALKRDLDREPGEVTIHVDRLVERDGSVPPPAEVVEPESEPDGPDSPAVTEPSPGPGPAGSEERG